MFSSEMSEVAHCILSRLFGSRGLYVVEYVVETLAYLQVWELI